MRKKTLVLLSERKSFARGRREKCVFPRAETFYFIFTIFPPLLFGRDEPRGAIHFLGIECASANLESFFFLISEAHFKLISRLSDTLPLLTRLNALTVRGAGPTEKRGQLRIIRRKWKTVRVEVFGAQIWLCPAGVLRFRFLVYTYLTAHVSKIKNVLKWPVQ